MRTQWSVSMREEGRKHWREYQSRRKISADSERNIMTIHNFSTWDKFWREPGRGSRAQGRRCYLNCPDGVRERIPSGVDQCPKAPLGGRAGCRNCSTRQHLHLYTHLGEASLLQDASHLEIWNKQPYYFNKPIK